jgi:hypothetical protein
VGACHGRAGGHWSKDNGRARRPCDAVHVLVDVTDRKKGEEALHATSEELERLNRAVVGRAMRMVELKKEINALCAQAGQPPRYPLRSEEGQG